MRLQFFTIAIIICQAIIAQSFKVKDFSMSISDLSASTQPRTDADGQPCGLVKVQTKIAGVGFDSQVVGDVENKTNEYWIYLPKGTKEFVIYRPDYLPMNINLAEYGLDAIAAKATYLLILKEINLNPEKCGLTIHVKPRDAEVKVDDTVLKVNSSGDYKLLLPKGEHIFRIYANGYKSDIKMVTSGKGGQDLNVELESLMADVNIVSQTGTAEIYVNGESKGVGGWKGKLLPGNYIVEARQKGYVSQTSNVTLSEKEKRTIAMLKLAPITSTLNIKSFPDGCKVYLDGEEANSTPCVLRNVLYGDHLVHVKLDSCGLQRQKEYHINVEDDKAQTIQCELATRREWNNCVNAIEWFKKGCIYDFIEPEGDIGYEEYWKAKEWYDRIVAIIDSLDASFLTTEIFMPEYIYRSHGVIGYNSRGSVGNTLFFYYTIDGYTTFYDADPDWLDPSDPDKAVLIAEKMGKKLEDHEITYVANAYVVKGNYQTAIVWYNKKKELDIDDYLKLGECYEKMKNKKEAIYWYKKAVEYGSYYSKEALHRLGVAGY